MKIIYHKQSGKISRRCLEDDWLVELDDGKQYHIVLLPDWVQIINSDGEELSFKRNKN